MRTAEDCQDNHAEIISGNIFIRPVKLAKAGDCILGHQHNFDHTTFVVKGTVTVKVVEDPTCGCGPKLALTAPAYLLIKAEREHTITAVSDDVEFWCVYSHRTPQGEVIQEAQGFAGAYV